MARLVGGAGGRWIGAVALGCIATAATLAMLGVARPGAEPAAPAEPGTRDDSHRVAVEPIRYGRDIRPILSDRCFQCHGPDAAKRQAELRLDLRESAVAARADGPAAIVPGDPDASELIRRVTASDPDEAMPPESSHKRAISAEEASLLRQWIEAGAPYEPHWAFVPPVRPSPPEAPRLDTWPRNEIDRFVLARLERESIAPSREADRATLARRAFLTLTGLPPTPEELDAFARDTRDDAYERLVDRLLTDEPYRTRYAERMTAPWLDQARYADTCGIHTDAGRQMWLWRDWVIDAYRNNMPFDRFAVEQVAGDLLPDATMDQKVASGFNRNHVTTDEGGAISEEYIVEYAVDRTATVGSVFLGLTLGCARCHDHKFDPITQQDFYNLLAYFNSIDEPGLYSQEANPVRAFEPFLPVPTPAQKRRVDELNAIVATLDAAMRERTPEELELRKRFASELVELAGVRWQPIEVVRAASEAGATLEPAADGSIVVSGTNAARDRYTVTLETHSADARLLALEILPSDGAPNGSLGRAQNGNAVITGIRARAYPVSAPDQVVTASPIWAWASRSQEDGDFDVSNLALAREGRVWALNGHRDRTPIVGLFLLDRPIGSDETARVEIELDQHSIYAEHNLARFRVRLGSIGEAGLAKLPSLASHWYRVGPFPPDADGKIYEPVFGPEEGERLDFGRNFGFGNQYWRYDAGLADDRIVNLGNGRDVTYVGRSVFAPTARSLEVSFGTDDGFKLYLNGTEVLAKVIDRSVAPNQDRVTLPLRAGENTIVLKIVNTGGEEGYVWSAPETADLKGDLALAILPEAGLPASLGERLDAAWRVEHLPRCREAQAGIAKAERERSEITAQVPLTMVMSELMAPRETFVLTRGVYDQPDRTRPAHRAIPAALGALPADAPANRLGLARWLVDESNPLTARVTVNRLWELCFGTGLVATSEDFGVQGSWPSHPELLDWLAVEFRESGWDVQHMLRLILTSATFRQDSATRPELVERDPENRLLASFPRRRLDAEEIRDQALFVSGLLVEKTGGPSVKPYQPDGLWQEVAMPQSNTRTFQRGEADDLWRRSLYTYWKRASPPPSMLAFDAPTREFCTIRRTTTSTPLQALVLWNDEQFVEAARVLAERTLLEGGADETRLETVFRRCTGREPDARERELLANGLDRFRARYRDDPEGAAALLATGESDVPEALDARELASWTMVASSILNLYETTTQR